MTLILESLLLAVNMPLEKKGVSILARFDTDYSLIIPQGLGAPTLTMISSF